MSDFPYILQTHTRFNDCDMYGHVNNVMYYNYFDTRQCSKATSVKARPSQRDADSFPSRFLSTVVNGFLVNKCGMHPTTGAVVGLVVQSTCRYIVSVNFPSRMALGLRVAQLGNTSCTFEIAVFTPKGLATSDGVGVYASSATLCALGKFVHVYCTRSNMRPTPIPREFREAMEKVAAPEVLEQIAKQKQKDSPATAPPASTSSSSTPSFSSSSLSAVSSPASLQSTSRMLMVRPVHFARNEETAGDNAFMHRSALPASEITRQACAEFDAYVTVLQQAGVEIVVHTPNPSIPAPDGVFPNNWISTHRRMAGGGGGGDEARAIVVHSMAHASRRRERDPALIQRLSSELGYKEIVDLSQYEQAGDIFEGTGSGIVDTPHKILYYCLSERSTQRQAERVAQAVWPEGGYTLVPFTSVDRNNRPHYHTNVVLSIGTSWAVICSDSINPGDLGVVLELLKATGHEVLVITHEQVESFCANVLEVQNTKGERLIAMSTRAYNAFTPGQREFLLRHVKQLVHTKLDTIEEIGGGGARCMLAELF
jgi:acyl-CoA thioesterase FadM